MGFESQSLWLLIPALDLLADHSDGGEEVSREQNEEAEAAHHDLASHETREMTCA